jgi:calcium-dependent protein kinase
MADADGSGEINYSEWLMTAINRDRLLSHEKLESIFKMLDRDGSKTISVEELRSMLGVARPMDQEIFAKAIKEVDN